MAFFCNENLSLHYLERGQGEPLVLIHGLGGSGADWAFQVEALEKRCRLKRDGFATLPLGRVRFRSPAASPKTIHWLLTASMRGDSS
jgi:pimeloyl-ACP methyl ester carboxylesterase